MRTIFDGLAVSTLAIKNRIAAASVGRNLADIEGHIPESLYDIYRELAEERYSQDERNRIKEYSCLINRQEGLSGVSI